MDELGKNPYLMSEELFNTNKNKNKNKNNNSYKEYLGLKRFYTEQNILREVEILCSFKKYYGRRG